MSDNNQNPDEINLSDDADQSQHLDIEIGGSDEQQRDQPGTREFNPLQRLLKEKEELEDRILRTQAEAENIRKRLRKEMEDARKYQNLDLARGLLPVVDNLSRAVSAAENNASLENLLIGVKMVVKQFEGVLNQFQIQPIASIGETFDANIHEALQMVPHDDAPAMTILQVVEDGYRLHDRVIRPAKVIVSSGPASADT